MSELYEFTAEEMKGCPPMGFCSTLDNRLASFVLVNVQGKIVVDTFQNGHEFLESIKCKPHDRMMAICKHLFELMPEMNEIYISIKELPIIREGDSAITSSMIELSINPFIGTELTEITREEVIND